MNAAGIALVLGGSALALLLTFTHPRPAHRLCAIEGFPATCSPVTR